MKRESSARLDVDHGLDPHWLARRFAALGPLISGSLAGAELQRLSGAVIAIGGPVHWQIHADESAPDRDLGKRFWLSVTAEVQLTCERCLEPMSQRISVRQGFEFAASSQEADQRTGQGLSDEPQGLAAEQMDLLAPEDGLSLRDLAEDELLLALAPAPKHADCQSPAASSEPSPRTTKPFAGLKDLMKKS